MSVKRARIWLCADDYGISPSVNSAIRDLIARGRLNATSVMVVAPSFQQSEAASLNALNAGTRRAAIGLHVTLTAPFKPLSAGFERTHADAFLSLPPTLVLALMHRFKQDQLAAEISAQVDAFVAKFGRAPDFIDGHQHVQLFPQIRDAFLRVAKAKAPLAWEYATLEALGGPQRSLARCLEPRFSRPRRAVRRANKYGFRGHLQFFRRCRLCQNVSKLSRWTA
jgi:hypothetical protein